MDDRTSEVAVFVIEWVLLSVLRNYILACLVLMYNKEINQTPYLGCISQCSAECN